jgi:hypothetical protein
MVMLPSRSSVEYHKFTVLRASVRSIRAMLPLGS